MIANELFGILDDETRELTVNELKEIIYRLKQDVFSEYCEALTMENLHISQFYLGEDNAFQICLDLLERLAVRTTP